MDLTFTVVERTRRERDHAVDDLDDALFELEELDDDPRDRLMMIREW